VLFFLKKAFTSCILPPGIFVLLAAVFSFYVKGKPRVLFFILAVFMYLLAIPFVSTRLVSLIEYRSEPSDFSSCDVIVLLGGGVIENAADLSGRDALSQESVVRTCDAARIWMSIHKPIIICGGSVNGSPAESLIAARYLRDLGVSAADIIVEDRSRDTTENAENASVIMQCKSFRQPLVVTSSWHCRRAGKKFRESGITPLLFPSGKSGVGRTGTDSFLPSAFALRESSLSLKELVSSFF
jgi:uncharacterized SAM-binding protein YcdF (DUF218 family)